MPLAYFSSRILSVFEVQDLHIAYSNRNWLRYWFIFRFVLLGHIPVGHTNIFFCGRLNFNPFSHTFVNFTIFILTWYDFTSYYILLTMSISSQVFHNLSIHCRCIIYVTTWIAYTGFGIIALWIHCPYSPFFFDYWYFNNFLWIMYNRVIVFIWIVIM